MTRPTPQVVITGLGMVTALGSGRESTWNSLIQGKGAVRRLDSAELFERAGLPKNRHAAARFLGAPATLSDDSTGSLFETEPNIRLALVAANEAVLEAGIDWERIPPRRRGCVIGTSKGGMQSIAKALAAKEVGWPSEAPEELWPMFWPNTPASLVAERWKFRGPALCPVAACATGLMSLWRGAELIREGVCDLVLAGSTDASLQPAVLGAFSRMGVLAQDREDPGSACRPFDGDRDGFVVGEGAAVLVMERADLAISRGASAYATWLAGGCVSDPTGIAHLNPDGTSLTWLIKHLLEQSRLGPADIDYLNLHGTGTRGNDRTESRAVREALRNHADGVSCSSVKGAIGHCLGAAGSIETALTLLAMRDGRVPPTRNLTSPDPECDLDYTPQVSKAWKIRHAMKLSLGFGGHQVAAVFGPP